jgi:hypothetical protein
MCTELYHDESYLLLGLPFQCKILHLYGVITFCFAWLYFRSFPNATLVNTSTTETEMGEWNCWFVQTKLKAFLNGNLLTVKKQTFSMIQTVLWKLAWAVAHAPNSHNRFNLLCIPVSTNLYVTSKQRCRPFNKTLRF